MKMPTAPQMGAWDAFTMSNEPISSVLLMERAAGKCADWLWQKFANTKPYVIFCGNGNNGGDGLVIARMLHEKGSNVQVHVLAAASYSADFTINEQRYRSLNHTAYALIDAAYLPAIPKNAVVVDALFGTGLNKPTSGDAAQVIEHINASGATVVAVDVPSGLFVDEPLRNQHAIIKAKYTLKFQAPAYSFMFAESYPYVGDFILLDIGLHAHFEKQLNTSNFYTDVNAARSIYKPRHKFDHKGTFGHALLIVGSEDKAGAAVMSAKAALRSGCGLLSVFIPASERSLLLQTVPEAMLATSADGTMAGIDVTPFKAVGIGPGLGKSKEVQQALLTLLPQLQLPVVLDADALNIIAEAGAHYLPLQSIITPHVKELERLCGTCTNSIERLEKAKALAAQHQLYVVVKGAHTAVVCPDGKVHFNATGNPGLAKGGSGDVLTGVLTALLAQGYSPKEAAILGVYLHGHAADLALQKQTVETMLASDVVEELAKGFESFETK